jgi:hypothetical protein
MGLRGCGVKPPLPPVFRPFPLRPGGSFQLPGFLFRVFIRDIRLFFDFPMPFIAAILHKGRSISDVMDCIAMNVTEIQ